ncbi:glyoxalase superfamily protein [Nocardia abscessus]|uniref:glyoxalase superfamily protein n=1 Tax=Nocardia abscessus TaxID=120957 RepID=UPI00245406F7|nr:glyoxalase superfamily protein [Nocardia abscessus]
MTAIHLASPVPVLRMFDVARAYEFYRDYLGFTVDWEHRFGAEFPLYAQVSRAEATFHLSEHHGDGTPRSVVWIAVGDVFAWHAELAAKSYRYAEPGHPETVPAVRASSWSIRPATCSASPSRSSAALLWRPRSPHGYG